MATVYSALLGADCDSASEAWRHECECRWLLKNKPDIKALHLYLYGVEQRDQVVTRDTREKNVLLTDHARLWKEPKTKPLSAYRGIQAADRLLEDVLRLKQLEGALNKKMARVKPRARPPAK